MPRDGDSQPKRPELRAKAPDANRWLRRRCRRAGGGAGLHVGAATGARLEMTSGGDDPVPGSGRL